MTEYRYRIVNVFTRGSDRFSGNPLCVFENGATLGTASMQALARQFNLSETTFILPSAHANARVRIFTPQYEMPFAGHPTLGTAYVCHALGLGGEQLALEMQAGTVPVRAQGRSWTLQARKPAWRECDQSNALLAELLGLQERQIAGRPLWVNTGKEQLVVPLGDQAAVRHVRPRADIFQQLVAQDGAGMAYVFAPAGPASLLARFYFPQGAAVLEDPATGSATANLGGWMLATGRQLPCSFSISQGEEVGRISALRLEVSADRHVFVGGEVIEIGQGVVTL